MSVFTHKERVRIEAQIRSYYRNKSDIAEWREAALAGKKRDVRARKQMRHFADPTAEAAIKLSSPPKRIREKEIWVKVVESLRRQYAGKDKGALLEMWYWSSPRKTRQEVAEALYLTERQIYNLLSEIVVHAALVAAQRGVDVFK